MSPDARLLETRLVPRPGPGNYFLIVCPDVAGAVTDSNEIDNCTASTTQVTSSSSGHSRGARGP